MKQLLYTPLLLLFILGGCSTQIESPAELEAYLNTASNGFVQKKMVNNFVLTARLLPPEYLAWSASEGNVQQYHKKLEEQGNSIAFLFTVGLEDKPEIQGKDVSYYNVHNEAAYKERQYLLNFGLSEAFELSVKGQSFAPAIYNFENTYSLSSSRVINLVFVPDKSSLQSLKVVDLIYTDPVFDTGINHFQFNIQELKVPKLNFIQDENPK